MLEAQHKASERQTQALTCADIMSKDVITLQQDDDIQLALDKFKQVNLMSLPVVNAEQQLVGTLALYEVVEWFKHPARYADVMAASGQTHYEPQGGDGKTTSEYCRSGPVFCGTLV